MTPVVAGELWRLGCGDARRPALLPRSVVVRRRSSAHVVDHLGDRSRHDGSLKPALKPRQISLGLDLPSDASGTAIPGVPARG
jgi:hypothetical protein